MADTTTTHAQIAEVERAEMRRLTAQAYYESRKADPDFKARRNAAVKRFYERNPDKVPKWRPRQSTIDRLEAAMQVKAAELEALAMRHADTVARRAGSGRGL